MSRYFIFALLSIALLSCGAVKRGDIVEEYSNNIIKLGMRPVYPPREDINLGDIFIVSVPKTDGTVEGDVAVNPADFLSLYVANDPNVMVEAKKYLKSRVVFRKSNVVRDVKDEDLKHQDDLFDGDFTTRNDQIISTLPIVAFPSITADAGASGGIGVVNTLSAIGLGGGARTTVTLNFSEVRSLSVPVAKVFSDSLETAVGHLFGGSRLMKTLDAHFKKIITSHYQQRRIRAGSPIINDIQGLEDRCYKMMVVTDLYLTRKMTYTYNNGRIASAALKRSEGVDTDTPSTAQDVNSVQPIIIQLNTGTEPQIDTSLLAESELQQHQENTLKSITTDVQGDSLRFTGWSAFGVSFEREFARPVVIGWKGFELQPDMMPNGLKNECLLKDPKVQTSN